MPRPTRTIAAGIVLVAIACRSEPIDTQALLTAHSLGLNDLRRGQLAQAEEQFRIVVKLAPKDATGFANLGLTFLRGGQFDKAEAELRRARSLNPASADVGLILARLYSLTNRKAEARKTLEALPGDARVLFALAELDAEDTDSAATTRHVQRLREVLTASPANVAVRLRLADALLRRGEADSVARHLEELRRLRPEPPREAKPHLDTAIQELRAGRVDQARVPFDRFLRRMEVTSPYQASLDAVKWVDGPLVGRPVLTFNPTTLIQTRGLIPVNRVPDVRFVDVTGDAGFAEGGPVTTLAVGDYDGDGADDVLAAPRLYHVQGGYVADVSAATGMARLPAGTVHAAFGDYDNDGWLDLFAIGSDRRGKLLRNSGNGSFVIPGEASGDPRQRVAQLQSPGARKALWADLDHDGDVDLLVAGDSTRLHRNNLDGTFTDVAAAAGLEGASSDAAIGDFDGDGRLDLVAARPQGVALYHNAAFQQFRDVTAARGLASGPSKAVAVGDYDNDGWLDILILGEQGEPALWRNTGDGNFAADRRSAAALAAIARTGARGADFFDSDNDGWLDLVAAGPGGAVLLRNTGGGRFEDRTRNLPASLRSDTPVIPTDVDGDGDLDLLLATNNGVRILRNDGGNARMALQVQLTGLRTGSGKNNTFGVGSRVEVRAGEIYQTRVVTNRLTHFGLGPHLKADVIRIEWTNGVPETVFFPGTDEDILELETLKGSCAFLYTWDGKAFRFVTDVMWRSALGMPLGIMGGAGGRAYAPAGASQEYLRIPGDALQPRNGRYVLQFTEELWETAFLDEVRLVAVDHPDSAEVFVDERFVPPGPVQLRMLRAVNRRPPLSAVDERGDDVLPALREKDEVYASNLVPSRYQGVVEPHELILDLGPDVGRSTYLVLRGWIYPSDASINVALAQQNALKVSMPSLEVRDARGQWVTAASIGFPSGKDKTIVIDLAGKFPTSDHRVRIRTNMQIYWDQAFVAADDAAAVPVRTTTLRRLSADLHHRGYSRMYRKGGGNGPHWFDYATVSQESPWRTITGAFTRFGDVGPLLDRADDQYVIMAPGDEATVEFDASSASAVPPGWKRTFLLYTDGWIKDADLNTAFGNTVEPLPFHAIKEYPYASGESYPADEARKRYLREYNTRVLGRRQDSRDR